MKRKNLRSILAFSLSVELIISPIISSVHAQAPAAPRVDGTAQTLDRGLQVIGTVLGQIRPAAPQQSNNFTRDMQALAQQQTPGPDKYFTLQKLSRIPGLGEYLASNGINPNSLNCTTLPTSLHDAQPEVCRLGYVDDSGVPPQVALGNAFGYYNQYFQIEKLYDNFTKDSNAGGQAFGVGCMNNALQVLNGFFQYRLNELDKLTTNLEAMQNQFKKQSRADLDALEEAVALLNGDSELANKVRTRNPDLLDFGKQFNDPSCNAMLTNDGFNQTGRQGGLTQINDNLRRTFTTRSGNFSGEIYTQSNGALEREIESLAKNAADQFQLSFSVLSKNPDEYSKFLTELPRQVSSTNGLNRAINPGMFTEVQTKFNQRFTSLNEDKNTILRELRSAQVDGQVATELLGNTTSSNFDNEVSTLENRLKNRCFEQTLSEVNRDRLMNAIYDPTASKHANNHASNFLKDKLNRILDNRGTSLEKKLAELRALEAQTKGRYYMKMENAYEVQEVDANGNLTTRVVGASSNRTPSVYFSDLIKNCDSQFRANKLDNKLTGASAIKRLRDLNTEYKDLAKTQAQNIRQQIRDRLINCDSPEKMNASIPGSCNENSFNTTAPGFCTKGALACSVKMKACTDKIDKVVKDLTTQKTVRSNNYNALVKRNRDDMVKIFDSALSRYMRDGEAMRGMFGAGFSSPAGIQREVSEESKYLNDFRQASNGELLLENPDAYIALFRGNIQQLKQSVQQQQEQILGSGGRGGILADHVQKTQRDYEAVEAQAKSLAANCLRQHDKIVNDQAAQRRQAAEQQAQTGQQQAEFCRRFDLARGGHPDPACSGSIEDMFSAVGGVANQLAAYCAQSQGSSGGGNSTLKENAISICIENGSWRSDSAESQEIQSARQRVERETTKHDRAKEDLAEARASAAPLPDDSPLIEAEVAARNAKREAEDQLKQLLDSLPASVPSSNTGGVEGACIALKSCHDRRVLQSEGSGTSTTRTYEYECRSTPEESSLVQRVVAQNGGQTAISAADAAPAFCQAADNSPRSNFDNFLDTIQRNLATPVQAGAYNQ